MAGSAASTSCTWLTCQPRHAVIRRHRRNGKNLDEIEQELCTQAAGQLRASGAAWEFERLQGIVVDELIAAATAIGEAHPDETLAIFVGSSSPGNHRVVGSVAVGLARHSPVPLITVP
jgi:nucleotide-binding universal stress UspA family protein